MVRYKRSREELSVADLKIPPDRVEATMRLRDAVHDAGGPAKVSIKTGIPLSTLNNYLSGRHAMKAATLTKIAHAAGCSAEWLMTGKGDKKAAETFDIAEAHKLLPRLQRTEMPVASGGDMLGIPYYENARASAGGGALNADELPRYAAFDVPWLRRTLHVSPAELLMMSVEGNSMEPTLRSGEVVLVDRSERGRAPGDGIYVFRLDGNILVKRLQQTPGRIVQVLGDNGSFRPYSVSLDAGVDFEILGRVIVVFRRL